jgi:hypothetical protein
MGVGSNRPLKEGDKLICKNTFYYDEFFDDFTFISIDTNGLHNKWVFSANDICIITDINNECIEVEDSEFPYGTVSLVGFNQNKINQYFKRL